MHTELSIKEKKYEEMSLEAQEELILIELRDWLDCHPKIRNCRKDSSFLLRFIRQKKYNTNAAKTGIECFLQMRVENPHWFHNLDCLDPKFVDITYRGYFFALPERDELGRRVFFSVPGCLDTSKDTSTDMMRAAQLGLAALIENEENQKKGFAYITDTKNVGLSIASLWTFGDVTKAFKCTEKTLPIKHKAAHFIRLPFTILALFEIAKSLVSPKIRQRIQVHSNVDGLHSKVSKSLLPAEYGGEIPMNKMIESYLREVAEVRSRVLSLDCIEYGNNKNFGKLS